MPRVKERISKSQFIRDFLSQNPEATNDEIIRAGRRAKVKVTTASIGYVRYKKPNMDQPTSPTAPTTDGTFVLPAQRENPFAEITKAKAVAQTFKEFESVRKFCESHGGIERTKSIIEAMEKYEQLKALLN